MKGVLVSLSNRYKTGSLFPLSVKEGICVKRCVGKLV